MVRVSLAIVAAGACVATCGAFTPSTGFCPTSSRGAASICRQPALRQATQALRMGYLDEISTGSEKIQKGLDEKGKKIMPSVEYEEFVDASSGFDGGDGQVGVVGDGKNAMDEFDTRAIIDNSIGGRGKVSGASKTNRVDKRWNAWGSEMPDVTEDLKNQGVVQYDVLTGEDMKKINRQQLNNWFAQRAVWAKESAQREEIEGMNGGTRQKTKDDYFAHLSSGKSSDELTEAEKENIIFATGARGIENKEALVKTDWKPVKEGRRVDGQFEIKGTGMVSIMVEPNSMVSEAFIARFTDDTDKSLFVVAKNGYDLGELQVQGQLPRRGTPTEFVVRFNPTGPLAQPKVATLVIDAEDGWKWTYKVTGST